MRESLRERLHRWRETTGDQLPTEAQGTAIADRFMAEFFANAQEAGPDREALPSRRPLGEDRELADGYGQP